MDIVPLLNNSLYAKNIVVLFAYLIYLTYICRKFNNYII